jgi:hypothetical protein
MEKPQEALTGYFNQLTQLTKRCLSCGRKLQDQAAFCDGCGVSQPEARKPDFTEEIRFVTNVAAVLFAISLGFSIEFSNRNLGFFPTVFWYRGGPTCLLNDVGCRTAVLFIVLLFLALLGLGSFWHYREKIRRNISRLPLAFIAYLTLGTAVGLTPWLAYVLTRLAVGA